MSVQERRVRAGGLMHHVIEWPASGEQKSTVMLGHGFLDLGWSFRALAERLSAAGHRVLAWDWRGHGETEWVGAGGYYHFPDYALDLRDLVDALAPDEQVHLLGHSMGGTISTMYAGVKSERLRTLTLVEGLGPPSYPFEKAPRKMRAWFESMDRHGPKRTEPGVLPNVEAALARMRVQNPELGDELGRFLAERGTMPAPDGDGRVWRFDPLHRTTSPMPFREEVFGSFMERIRVPTLVVAGEKGFRLKDEAERYGRLKDHRFVEIPGVGHMIHWFEPDRLADAWLEFVAT